MKKRKEKKGKIKNRIKAENKKKREQGERGKLSWKIKVGTHINEIKNIFYEGALTLIDIPLMYSCELIIR